jgi:hypothetical protein
MFSKHDVLDCFINVEYGQMEVLLQVLAEIDSCKILVCAQHRRSIISGNQLLIYLESNYT